MGKGGSFADARYCGYWRFRSELSEGLTDFVDLKEEGSIYIRCFMSDGANAHIPLVTAWDCECRTFSLPIILGR